MSINVPEEEEEEEEEEEGVSTSNEQQVLLLALFISIERACVVSAERAAVRSFALTHTWVNAPLRSAICTRTHHHM